MASQAPAWTHRPRRPHILWEKDLTVPGSGCSWKTAYRKVTGRDFADADVLELYSDGGGFYYHLRGAIVVYHSHTSEAIWNSAPHVVVVGSRSFTDYELMCNNLDHLLQDLDDVPVIISGGARGADTLAEKYARDRALECIVRHARWATYGKKAEMYRNLELLKSGTHVVAFWDGCSPGTRHLIQNARQRELPLRVVRSQGPAATAQPSVAAVSPHNFGGVKPSSIMRTLTNAVGEERARLQVDRMAAGAHRPPS